MAKRTPAERSAPIHASVEFLPNWYYASAGIEYGEAYYFEPRVRLEADMKARRYLWQRFGDLGMGEENPAPRPTVDFGMCLLPAVFGCEIRFFPNNHPRAVGLNLSPEAAAALAPPDLLRTEPMLSLVQQMDWLEQEYGPIEGDLNTTGVLNLLLDLRGSGLYVDLYDRPELVHHLVSLATEAIIELARYTRDRWQGSEQPYMHPNCSNVHISRKMYERFFWAADARLSAALQPFGIHQCGNADELIEAYASIPGVSHVDVHATTNRRLLAAAFPDGPLTVTLSPILMRDARPSEIVRALRGIVQDLGRPAGLTVSAPALDCGTPDGNVRALLQAVEEAAHTTPLASA